MSDPGNKTFGGTKDGADIPNPQSTADFIRRAACSMSNPESQFYQSTVLLQEMDVALRHLLTVQYTDGTIDLPATNFQWAYQAS